MGKSRVYPTHTLPLSVVLISLYKKDMVAILLYFAKSEGMATTYDDRTTAARSKQWKHEESDDVTWRRMHRIHLTETLTFIHQRSENNKEDKWSCRISRHLWFMSFLLGDIVVMKNFPLVEAEDSTVYQALHNPLNTCRGTDDSLIIHEPLT